MNHIGSLLFRHCLRGGKPGFSIQNIKVPRKWFTTTSIANMQAEPLNPQENFWDKNKRLNRPTSPHLTIYKPQITWILSITHRGTGLAMSGLISGFAIGMLALPHSFPHYYQILSASPSGTACLFAAKFLLAFPLTFHFANGVRHLAWDLGKGFKLKDLYMSGYTVVGLSLIIALAMAAM